MREENRTVYVTGDGSVFEDHREALKHEARAGWETMIEAFLGKQDLTPRAKAMMRSPLMKFAAWAVNSGLVLEGQEGEDPMGLLALVDEGGPHKEDP